VRLCDVQHLESSNAHSQRKAQDRTKPLKHDWEADSTSGTAGACDYHHKRMLLLEVLRDDGQSGLTPESHGSAHENTLSKEDV
jgi:hypothetical protein